MSALHRNALLDDSPRCLICAEVLPDFDGEDHCARCVAPDASKIARPPILEPRWPLAALILFVLIFMGAML